MSGVDDRTCPHCGRRFPYEYTVKHPHAKTRKGAALMRLHAANNFHKHVVAHRREWLRSHPGEHLWMHDRQWTYCILCDVVQRFAGKSQPCRGVPMTPAANKAGRRET